ncbi:Uncharacterised protein [uncultured archaeon]|nr:Uncharacterised protein [uncultured archaeon]
MKKEVRKAMVKAKEIEKIPVPTKEEIVSVYKEGMEEAEKLRKLLKPQWFVRDTDGKHCSEEHMKKSVSPTRKKKTL